jgi:hypothetical protein
MIIRLDNMMRRGEIMKEMSRRRCITDDEMNRGEREMRVRMAYFMQDINNSDADRAL